MSFNGSWKLRLRIRNKVIRLITEIDDIVISISAIKARESKTKDMKYAHTLSFRAIDHAYFISIGRSNISE